MQHKIISQSKQSTKSKRICVNTFFSTEIIKAKSNSHIPIDEAYMHRRLPELHLSPTNLVSLQNAWVPFGTVFGRLQPLFCLFCDTYVQNILFPVGQSALQPTRGSDFNLVKEYHRPLRIEHLDLPLPQGRFARPQCLPLLGSPASSLEPWTATTRTTSITMHSLATVAVASVTST